MDPPFQRIWTYRSGQQFPSSWMPTKGTSIASTLGNHPMVEITEVKKKQFSAVCHSCNVEYANTTAQTLANHVVSSKHQQYLKVESQSPIEQKEQVRRQGLLDNSTFSQFLNYENEVLMCKFCHVELQFDWNKLHTHSVKLDHKSAMKGATSPNDSTQDKNDEHRLELLRKLVAKYPDELKLATLADVQANSLLESYSSASSLRVNDLFCSICRQSFTRVDDYRFRQAVVQHLKSELHDKAATKKKDRQAVELQRRQSGVLTKPPTTPPRKICPFRASEEDLKEIGRHFTATNLAVSQCDTSTRRLAAGIVHRPISAPGMIKGIKLLAEDIQKDARTQLFDKHIYIIADESSVNGKPVLDVTLGALGVFDCKFPIISGLEHSPNGESIAAALLDALRVVFSTDEGILEHQSQIRLFMSDGAPYLVTAVTLLRQFGLQSLQHNTCIVHGLDLAIKKGLVPHQLVITFMTNVLTTLHFSKVRQDLFKACSNSHFELELLSMLYQKEVNPDLSDFDSMLTNNTDGRWEGLLLESPCSQIWAEAWGSIGEECVQDDDYATGPLPPQPVATRFASKLVCICFFAKYQMRIFNYVAKISRNRVRQGQETIYPAQQTLIDQGDELLDRLNFILEKFGRLTVFLAHLESQHMLVNEVEETAIAIEVYLREGSTHKDDERFDRCVSNALDKYKKMVDKRVASLFKLAREDPVMNTAPCHSITVEAHFSIIKFCLGERKHFTKENQANYLGVALFQRQIDSDATSRSEKRRKHINRTLFAAESRVKPSELNAHDYM